MSVEGEVLQLTVAIITGAILFSESKLLQGGEKYDYKHFNAGAGKQNISGKLVSQISL